MARADAILWVGRLLSVVFTTMILWDALADGQLSQEIRRATIGIVAGLFMLWAIWQIRIAYKYEGWPVIRPLPFRWVFAIWLCSITLFTLWIVVLSEVAWLFSDYRSAFVWWQFGAASIWVASRWMIVETHQDSGAGETGTGPHRARDMSEHVSPGNGGGR